MHPFRRLIAGTAIVFGALSVTSAVTAPVASAKTSQFCTDFAKVSKDKSLEAALKALSDQDLIKNNPAKAKVSIRKVVVVFQGLQKNAPPAITPDLVVIEKFFIAAENFVDKFSKAEKNPSAAIDAAKVVTDTLPKLNKSVTKLTAYTKKECGIS